MEEVKEALESIPSDRCLSSYGFGSGFFNEWSSIIWEDLFEATNEFFKRIHLTNF